MSALAKPLICTDAASLVGRSEPVNAEYLVSMSKVEDNLPKPLKDNFAIIFSMFSGGSGRPKEIRWSFKDEDERNSVFANIETYACQTITAG